MALSEAAALEYLAAHGIKHNAKTVGYLNRLVRGHKEQTEKNLPFSRKAARGRPITPEHPGRKRSRLPAPAGLYAKKRSKYSRLTEPLPTPTLRTPAPPVTRPVRHRRGDTVPVEGVVTAPGRNIHTAYTQVGAMRILRRLAHEDRGTWKYNRDHPLPAPNRLPGSDYNEYRVGFDIYDCTTGQWQSVYRQISAGRSEYSAGITVHELLRRLTDEEMSLEEYLLSEAIQGKSGGAPAKPLTHICAYVIYASKPQGGTLFRTSRRRR